MGLLVGGVASVSLTETGVAAVLAEASHGAEAALPEERVEGNGEVFVSAPCRDK